MSTPPAVEAGAASLFAPALSVGAIRDVLPLLDPRAHQATGMVEVHWVVGMADAFAHLRARAFTGQVPLGEPAADVVARHRRFHRDGGGP